MRRALTLIAGIGMISVALARDVEVVKSESEGFNFEKDQESEDFNKSASN